MHAGIYVMTDQLLFYSRNLDMILEEYWRDVGHWRSLSLSLRGRTALYKMIYLPKILYILQIYPYDIHDHYFGLVDRVKRLLLWDRRAAR